MLLTPRALPAVLLGALFVLLPGCSSKPETPVYTIGQKVPVGKLFYQVVDAQWQAELNGLRQPPKDRILRIHVMVTNSGGEEVAIPLLRLLDAKGTERQELTEIEGNERWLGIIRRLQPTITEEGHVFFDVPVGAYKLEVVDNSVAENEKVALIEIPASLVPPPPSPDAAKGL